MIGDLKPGTTYRISIAAYSQAGKGKVSYPRIVTTLSQGKIRLKSTSDGKAHRQKCWKISGSNDGYSVSLGLSTNYNMEADEPLIGDGVWQMIFRGTHRGSQRHQSP